MTMSLHLVRHTSRNAISLWRRRRVLLAELDRDPGIAAARMMASIDLRAVTGGTPRLRQAALLIEWKDRASRDERFADAVWPSSYAAEAREAWSVALDTARVLRSDSPNWSPSVDGVAQLRPDEPMAALTFGGVHPRYVPAFNQGNRNVLRELDDNSDETFRTGVQDGPLGFGTFTLWRSQAAMTRFAYRTPTHDGTRKRSEEQGWTHGQLFVRFRPVASRGTWQGRDPLAELLASRVSGIRE
ncbi:hypothetical protein [Gordonia araii]|nr:hypothetical protein [Gordonia araii]NNG97584.1 hypothetical protein [Gordonia araii NBRC 100433]